MFEFKSLRQLLELFSSDEVCRHYLEQKRWNGAPFCPHCGSTKVYRLVDGKTFKCGDKKNCDRKFTVTKGTVFENSKNPLRDWFAAIYLCTSHKKGISSLQLHRELGVTQKTAWFMLHRIREMILPTQEVELKHEVQVDETYVKGKITNKHARTRRKFRNGEIDNKPTIVVGMIENGGDAVCKIIPQANAENLLSTIYKAVPKINTVIVTDSLNSYKSLNGYYNHVTVNHTTEQYVNGSFHTNTVEGFFSMIKRTFYGISLCK